MPQHPIVSSLKELIHESLVQLSIEHEIDQISFEHPQDFSHGDYATSIAMQIFGKLKKIGINEYKNPRDFAEKIISNIPAHQSISKVEVAGFGFINFFLSSSFLLEEMLKLSKNDFSLYSSLLNPQRVVVEFTDPNPFKELHIGHSYSNSVGESISRLFELVGAEVKRACYQGDVGMHVAKSVWGMQKLLLKDDGSQADFESELKSLENQSLSEKMKFLGQAYALGSKEFSDNPQVAEKIKNINYLTYLAGQEELVRTTDWQPQVDYRQFISEIPDDYDQIKLLYQVGREWSLAYFDMMYARLGTKFDEFYFESLMGEYGIKIVREYLARGIFEKSQGAVIFPGSKYGLHDRVFINSLGLPTYEAKELGLMPEKYRRWPYDLSIIITGNEIDEYFKVLLTAMAQINPELAEKTRHLSHGMVRLPEGKMSSRTGNVLTTEWLIEEAKNRVLPVLKENNQPMSEKEQLEIAEKIAIGAIKFAYLKSNIGSDISFDFNESLSFVGKSGPYLQYTLVRCTSILSKSKSDINEYIDTLPNILTHSNYTMNQEEVDLLRNLYIYSEIVSQSAHESAPHMVCNYVYAVAQVFNVFYAHHQVLEAETEVKEFRLLLLKAVKQVISKCLYVLAIPEVDKM